MPARLDIALQRNEDWSRTISLSDDDDEPIDLTGCAIDMQIRDKLTQTLVASAEVEVLNPVTGVVGLTIRASEGSPLSRFGSGIQVANLHYDCRLTDSAGTHVPLFGGLIILSRGETRQ